MAKIDRIDVSIETGTPGTADPVRFQFNGHLLAFETLEGGTDTGQTYKGTFEVGSVGHSVALVGPDSGEWDIAGIEVTYYCAGEDPYTLRFAGVRLNESNGVNIWREAAPESFDV